MTLCIEAPGSKSMTQRALIIGALGEGTVRIRRALDCDDSRRLSTLLQAMGCRITADGVDLLVAAAPMAAGGQTLDCGNAGTALRFGACLALVAEGSFVLDGNQRLRQRPVGPLVDALRALGVRVRYLGADGCPPIELKRVQAPPNEVTVGASVSSQFASGLLLVASRLDGGLSLHLDGPAVSAPYLDMTTQMMRRSGVPVERQGSSTFVVRNGPYGSAAIDVEPDWSAAAFLLAGASLLGCAIQVPGLPAPERSVQGDAAFPRMLRELERARDHVLDLRHTPDLIAPLAARALFATHRTRIQGAEHTRAKESDRIAVLCSELRRLGASIQERPDGLEIEPLRHVPEAPIEMDPHDDHRMAMAFGLVALRVPGVTVASPGCVDKSFPGFWHALETLRAARDDVNAIEAGDGASRRIELGPALVGLRGSGKTTLAPLVARQLGLEWVDADLELERRAGRRISEILRDAGEPELRRLEAETLDELLTRPLTVVATGGGAVLHDRARGLLRRRFTVWLQAPVSVLVRRIAGSDRPSLMHRPPEEEMLALAAEREKLYLQVASMRLDTEHQSPDSLAREIAAAWVGKGSVRR